MLSQMGSDEERMTFLNWVKEVATPQIEASTDPGYANLISGREKLHQVRIVQHFSTHYILTLAGLPTFNASAGYVTQMIIRLITFQIFFLCAPKIQKYPIVPPSPDVVFLFSPREDLRRFCDVLTNLHTFSVIFKRDFSCFPSFHYLSAKSSHYVPSYPDITIAYKLLHRFCMTFYLPRSG